MIFLANILTFCGLVALGLLFKEIEWHWGQATVTAFCLGWIAATVMWQTVHKIRYGHWFDPPAIPADKGPANVPAARAVKGKVL